jgi:hypothetical protein
MCKFSTREDNKTAVNHVLCALRGQKSDRLTPKKSRVAAPRHCVRVYPCLEHAVAFQVAVTQDLSTTRTVWYLAFKFIIQIAEQNFQT